MNDTVNQRRARRDSHYTPIEYNCEDCGNRIRGHSGDPQEAPWLYCPDCNKEMNIGFER